MADPFGFLEVERAEAAKRPVDERIGDWGEVYVDLPLDVLHREVGEQATRCMDCGIPFCHSDTAGCSLGNLIPEWNDLVRRDGWDVAGERLHATNNFPELTGRLSPAPCEAACVLAISDTTGGPVTIKRVEQAIADSAWETGAVTAQPPVVRTGRSVAVVGSGPAGLTAAQQLTRAGHDVTVYERDDRLGGLLRYGIPEFKMAKHVLDRRLAQLRDEGTRFVTGVDVGVDLTVAELRSRHEAVVLAVGALAGRNDREVPGRDLDGVHLAMAHLVGSNHEREGDGPAPISASGKHVVIIGGGDTAADCLGTAHRQGAASVLQLDQYPQAPQTPDRERSPWPTWPVLLRSYPAQAEGGQRRFAVAVQEFRGDGTGHVRSLVLSEVEVSRVDGRRVVTPVGEPQELPCDLALLAIGFEGAEPMVLLDELGLQRSPRGPLWCGPDWQTASPGVFVCGDAHRGASLVVWAIAEGRSVAHAVDTYLTGESDLPSPVHPTPPPLAVV